MWFLIVKSKIEYVLSCDLKNTLTVSDVYQSRINLKPLCMTWFDFWCLMPLSAIFQLFHGDQYQWWKMSEYPERTTDHGQATGNLFHLRLQVECTLFYNLQSRARTHIVLVIGYLTHWATWALPLCMKMVRNKESIIKWNYILPLLCFHLFFKTAIAWKM